MSLNNLGNPDISTKQSQSKKNIQQIRPWLYKPKKSRFGNRRTYKYNDKHWSLQQNTKYLEFLTQYVDLYQSDVNQKRKYHLNRMLSKCVGTRSPIQCRSHHQRMLKTYRTLQNIVKQFGEALKKETAEIQKSVRTQEVGENQQKSQEFKLLPDFELQSFFYRRKDSNDDDEIGMQLQDSNQDMFNKFFDL